MIHPAIIVLIRKGDELLLVHARNFKGRFHGLVAGFLEVGESLEQCVRREVMEETGIPAPEEGRLICVTDHTYHRDGQFVLKHTHWYAMRLTQPCSTRPQTEEGITQTAWVSAAELPGYAEQTFPSIREVLHSAGLLQELR